MRRLTQRRVISLLLIAVSIAWSSAAACAIAPSKLGRFVAQNWSSDTALILSLREAGLVLADVSDDALRACFENARKEDAALPVWQRQFNSPNERVRVFLAPYLSEKGQRWAVPLDSLELPDD